MSMGISEGRLTLSCRITPSGGIAVMGGLPEDGPALSLKDVNQTIEAFRRGRGEGVLHLCLSQLSTKLPPAFSYWRDMGRAFVSYVCGTLDPINPKTFVVPEPNLEDLAAWVRAIPPMLGAEIVDVFLLRDIWFDMGEVLSVEAKKT